MPKTSGNISFVCEQCGAQSPRWLGRCTECSTWDSLVETAAPDASSGRRAKRAQRVGTVRLNEITMSETPRIRLPYREVNRVLGGGIVPGSLILIGGDPGIGKSTLLLQTAQAVAAQNGPVLYVSGEESPQQVRLRADRLGAALDGLLLLAETDLGEILRHLDESRPSMAVIDSVQTMRCPDLTSAAGSVAQVRECTLRVMEWAKSTGIPVLIAGHVTKDGAIAGPRVLEHMVDVVLYLEGEPFSSFRVLRSAKNRFGSSNEAGIFEMNDTGLREVDDPSRALLSSRQESAVGSAIVPTLEGTRPLLVEVQALVTPTSAPVPRRTANGLDFNRLVLITAVLTKHLRLPLASHDIIVNVAGGLRISEPAADLAAALAIVSSLREAPVVKGCVAIAEIGLTGELRPVRHTERRVAEAAQMGFNVCILPGPSEKSSGPLPGMELREARSVGEAARIAITSPRHA